MKNDKRSYDNRSQSYSAPAPYYDKGSSEKDDEELENDKWNPTELAFQTFLDRDFELAQSNVTMAMLSRGLPMSLKELKESTLHSIDCLERVLSSKLASGLMAEIHGKFGLVK